MLERKIYNKLLMWKNSRTDKCLMISGPRQVGKTYIVEKFAEAQYKSFVELNFIKTLICL